MAREKTFQLTPDNSGATDRHGGTGSPLLRALESFRVFRRWSRDRFGFTARHPPSRAAFSSILAAVKADPSRHSRTGIPPNFLCPLSSNASGPAFSSTRLAFSGLDVQGMLWPPVPLYGAGNAFAGLAGITC